MNKNIPKYKNFLASLFPLGGIGYPQPVMGQSAYPNHTGLVTRPEDGLLLCVTAEGFQVNFSWFYPLPTFLKPLGLSRSRGELEAML